MHFNKSGFILGFFCFVAVQTSAQVTSVSPFSRFGLGEIQSEAFAAGFGSGGLTQAFRSPRHLNIGNPASHASNRLTSFEAGLSHNSYLQQAGLNVEPNWNNRTNLGYMAVGIPLTKSWGLSASISPFAQTGFKSTLLENHPDFGEIEYLLNGAGSISRFTIGSGIQVFKGLSVGANANYVWGRRIQTSDVIFNSRNFFNFRTEDNLFIQGFTFDFGFQYVHHLNDRGLELVLGGTYSPGADLSQERILLDYTFARSQGVPIPRDTTSFFEDNTSSMGFPQSMGLGFAIQRSHKELGIPIWMFSAEYRRRDWSTFSLPGSSANFVAAERLAAGVSFIPILIKDSRGKRGNFFERMEYRAGFFQENSFIVIDDFRVQDYGMTFGLGVPLNHKVFVGEEKYSKFTLSAALGTRGNLTNIGYRERYALLLIGISINDKWFNKFKYR
jgi:hypothetical protein